jgi:RHS repeat-associated protein
MESVLAIPAGKRIKLAFAYDAQSRRIQKQVWQAQLNAPHAWILTQKRRFCYDGWNLILELDPDGTPFRKYLWGLDLSNTPQGAGGVNGLLYLEKATGPDAGLYYPTYDGNGNLTGLITAPTGLETATFTYDPFGQPLTATGPAAKVTPFGFSTKYTDPETTLCYYGFRYYDPKDGRWLGRDPISEGGGMNVYGMVGNDPVDLFDVLGLQSDPAAVAIYDLAIADLTTFIVANPEISNVTGLSSAFTRLSFFGASEIRPNRLKYKVYSGGLVAAWQPFFNDMILGKKMNAPGGDLLHELHHAFWDLNDSIWEGDRRTNEGVGYAIDYQTNTAIPALASIYSGVKNGSKSRAALRAEWRNFWYKNATAASRDVEGNANFSNGDGFEGFFSGRFTVSTVDYVLAELYYGIGLDCQKIANVLNALPGAKGCPFSCEPGSGDKSAGFMFVEPTIDPIFNRK